MARGGDHRGGQAGVIASPVFVATYFTLAGNIGPFDPVTISPHPLIDRARAAAEAGYSGMGFGHQDIAHLLRVHGAAEVRAILDDHGIAIREVEVLTDWFATGERRIASDIQRREMLHAAQAIGARHIKVAGDLVAPFTPLDATIEAFAILCDQAADIGTAVTIELFPPSSIASLETGRAIVEGAGCANGGLLLDIWHMLRGGIGMDAIGALPPGLVTHVELDDGPIVPEGDFLEETINARLPPGGGAFPITDFLDALRACGYAGPFGVEILSHRFRGLMPEDAARESLAYVAAQFPFPAHRSG